MKKILSLAGLIALGFLANKNLLQSSAARKPLTTIVLTKHAKCRMQCRKITRAEIEEVLTQGRINSKKTDTSARPCPIQVKEKRVNQDQQLIRVVAAQCQNKTKIVTVIDLERNYNCSCK